MKIKINQISPWIDKAEPDALKNVIGKKFLTEKNETKKFENNLSTKFKCKNVITYNNWTLGLFACLKILNLPKNSEVIVPNLTFIATINSVILANLKPVLCEIDKNNLSLDLKKLKEIINKKTKVIIPVHLYGNSCNLDELKKICKKNKIFLIEDAAQSIGGTYKNKHFGTIGDMGGISLYGNKIITTGQGAIIFSKNKKFRNQLYSFKNYGRSQKGIYVHKEIGYNFAYTEMQAAVGNVQLKKIGKILKYKKFIYQFYKKKISDIKYINFIQAQKGVKLNYWFSNILVNKKHKKKLQLFLSKKGIETRNCFYPLNKQPCFKKYNNIGNLNKKFEISKNIYDQLISLPSSYGISTYKLNYIVSNIREYFSKI